MGRQNKYLYNKITNTETSLANSLASIAMVIDRKISSSAAKMPKL